MKLSIQRFFIFCLFLFTVNLFQVSISQAQAPVDEQTCRNSAQLALTTVQFSCFEVGRNQACYGNRLIDVEFREDQLGVATFETIGDQVSLNNLVSLHTADYDAIENIWGIALIKAQLQLPDALPGQNVTMLLFGDAQLDNLHEDMSVVRLSTGLGGLQCANIPPASFVIQSPQNQALTMNVNGAAISFGSTLIFQIIGQNEGLLSLRVTTLEGTGTVLAQSQAVILPAGSTTTLPLDSNLMVAGPPSPVEPYDRPQAELLPLSLLERSITLPEGINPTTDVVVSPTPDVAITPPSTGCVPRADWTATYIVGQGNTLSQIAGAAGVSLNEMVTGNCLEDASRIFAGQVLQVPRSIVLSTQTFTPTPTSLPTQTPTPLTLRATRTEIYQGECTTILWSIEGIDQIYFNETPTVGTGQQEVCPSETTTYNLRVVYRDGSQQTYPITITVVIVTPG